ncbi:MAG: undecaprenyldiphospho-muramoylpentapeptide beta-N-acetylglucosaminyltransferase [Xanthomonadaceae bacterium]|nr:undecaprenyldiphospho-muramoylpentapeptide beta-N-acetylglucosaminyltransferase [Xanthomonadaceae bacterium]
MKTLLIAGGGTGGHVLAGIALAQEWLAIHGTGARVQFVGAVGGLEEKLVPKNGFTLDVLNIGALNRVSKLRRFKTIYQLPLALLKSVVLFFKYRPDAVIGVGGYASGPMVLVSALFGKLFGTRTAILEQNSVAGFTNRILSKFVDRVFLALPIEKTSFSPSKIKITGNPIRNQLAPLASPGFDPFTLFIFGGSQGAMGINTLIIQALPFLKKYKMKFIHQTGVNDYERVKAAYTEQNLNARVEKFIDQMPECYKESTLIVCRAGSSTLAELAAVGRAAIFVPLPTAADNHQETNAKIFTTHGAGWLLSQTDSNGEKMAALIGGLVENHQYILDASEKVKQFYKPHASRDLIHFL